MQTKVTNLASQHHSADLDKYHGDFFQILGVELTFFLFYTISQNINSRLYWKLYSVYQQINNFKNKCFLHKLIFSLL